MRGYNDIVRSTSVCVHFVEAYEVDDELTELRRELDTARIRCAYVDARTLIASPECTCDSIAAAIGAAHVPYGERGHWVKLLDDMITLSCELRGLVIVLDHADELFAIDRSQIFSLSESFLIQFHHWLRKDKPCHLCFQMSPHPLVGQVFAFQ